MYPLFSASNYSNTGSHQTSKAKRTSKLKTKVVEQHITLLFMICVCFVKLIKVINLICYVFEVMKFMFNLRYECSITLHLLTLHSFLIKGMDNE